MDKKRLAKIITDLSTPSMIGSIFLIAAFCVLSPDFNTFLRTISILLLIGVILPVAFTLLLVKKKVVSNFHLKIRKERLYPLTFALLSGIVAIALVRILGAPQKINEIMMIFYPMALGYSLITIKYKISGHAFVFTTSTLLLTAFININLIFLLLLLPLIGWSRVYLKEHTTREVITGFLYSIISFYLLTFIV